MKRLALLTLATLLTACGPLGPSAPTNTEMPMDGVKLLSTSITDSQDPRSMTQATYPISVNSRLLVRLEDFLEKVDQVSLASGNGVSVVITLSDVADAGAAGSHFKVCPVLKNWMMLATWNHAYPMGSDGNWAQAGGDFELSACIAVTSVNTTGNTSGNWTDVTFDVTPWFVNYVKGRSLNYGLVLISDQVAPITVKGDQDAYHAPRIKWMQ
jgi:hypothetical protein